MQSNIVCAKMILNYPTLEGYPMKKSRFQKVSDFIKTNFLYILMCCLSIIMLAVNFPRTVAKASPQLALTTISAEVVGVNPYKINAKTFAMDEQTTGDFDIGEVALMEGQSLEIVYHVGRLSDEDIALGVSLDTTVLKNIKVVLFVVDSSTNMLNSFDLTEGNYYTYLRDSDIEIKVVVSVADVSMCAQVLGNVSLSVRQLGEDNGGNS